MICEKRAAVGTTDAKRLLDRLSNALLLDCEPVAFTKTLKKRSLQSFFPDIQWKTESVIPSTFACAHDCQLYKGIKH